MDFVVEAILNLVGELLLQLVVQLLLDAGLHALAEPFRRAPNPWVAGVGYALLGVVLGFASLLAFPHYLTPQGMWRTATLVCTPLLTGALMALIGQWRDRRGQEVFRIDRFSYATLFAFSIGVVRFFFAKTT